MLRCWWRALPVVVGDMLYKESSGTYVARQSTEHTYAVLLLAMVLGSRKVAFVSPVMMTGFIPAQPLLVCCF